MKFLVIGDVVGRSGLEKLEKEMPNLVKQNNIDFIIVNGENSANGKGLRDKEYERIINAGADVITMGNHIYYRKEMAERYKLLEKLVLPANVTNLEYNPYYISEKSGMKIGVFNLIGNTEMGEMFEKNTTSAFKKADEIVNKLKEECDYIFLDFHAEATAEKVAMGYFLDGRVTCVFGTHTHVQTSDNTILEGGTAYITDVGMTGPKESVIGLSKEVALKRFLTGEYVKYDCSSNASFLNGIIVSTDDNTKKVTDIKRIDVK